MSEPIAHDRARTRPTRTQLRNDALLAVGLGVASACIAALTVAAAPFYQYQEMSWPIILWSFLFNLPLAARRIWPPAVALVVCASYGVLAHFALVELTASQVTMFLAFYTVGAWEARRRVAHWTRLVIVVGMGLWLGVAIILSFVTEGPGEYGTTAILSIWAIQVLVNIAYFTGAWVFGDRAWAAAVEREELEIAHASIRAQQEQLTEQAVGLERIRIARELHDVVAHHVSAMGIQAGAARRVMGRDEAKAEASLRQVEQSARDAIQELRTMVVALRSDDETNEPMPSLDDIESLLAASRDAGQRIDLQVVGPRTAVSPVVELTAYRVLQEALTNARKHAGPIATVSVRIRYLRLALEVEVADDGHGTPSGQLGTGMGLIGMRERVAAVGGSLESGPRAAGGWLVRARLPMHAHDDDAPTPDPTPGPTPTADADRTDPERASA